MGKTRSRNPDHAQEKPGANSEVILAYTRFGIYYLPPASGALAEFGARWLGWDINEGCAVTQPEIPHIAEITRTPRKYGFHGTLKPPFSLAPGRDIIQLQEAVAALALTMPHLALDGLELSRLGRFLALVPQGDTAALAEMAARIQRDLDMFRAPLTEAEIDRRSGGLTARQKANLLTWGYPYVMEDFRFHLTLTDRLTKPQRADAEAALTTLLPDLCRPVTLAEIALVGERADGMFKTLHRYPFSG